jgi:hypothetical protein
VPPRLIENRYDHLKLALGNTTYIRLPERQLQTMESGLSVDSQLDLFFETSGRIYRETEFDALIVAIKAEVPENGAEIDWKGAGEKR